MNALVIETAFLGDAIVSLSLARAIKASELAAKVSYLVRPEAVDIISCSPDVDRVIAYDKRGKESGIAGLRRKAEELNALGFDTIFLLHGSRRSQALVSLLNAKTKVGFTSASHAGLTDTIVDSGWANRYGRAIFPLTAIRDGADLAALPRIDPPPLGEFEPFFSSGEIVVLAPGSVWATKKWGDEKYCALANRLTQSGTKVVVIGGSAEKSIGHAIAEACPATSVLDMTGRVPFPVSAAAIGKSRLLVTNDSAPAHAAVAVGTQVLSIFGPTVPAFGFAPPKGRGEVIEIEGLWCRPCTTHGSNVCPIHTHACMRDISVDRVFAEVERMIGASKSV